MAPHLAPARALCYPLTRFFQHCDWNASISGQQVKGKKKRGRLSGANLSLKNKLPTFHRLNALVKNWSIQSTSWYQITFPFIYAEANWEAMHWKLYSCGYRSLEVKGNLLGLIASEISYHAHEILSLLFSTSSWLSGFSTSCHWKVCSIDPNDEAQCRLLYTTVCTYFTLQHSIYGSQL